LLKTKINELPLLQLGFLGKREVFGEIINERAIYTITIEFIRIYVFEEVNTPGFFSLIVRLIFHCIFNKEKPGFISSLLGYGKILQMFYHVLVFFSFKGSVSKLNV